MLKDNKVYTLSEFCKVLKESQEFKARKGDKVDSENKKNNGKAVNDILKQSKEFDGGISNRPKREDPRDTDDFNKTTLDLDFDFEPNDNYKKRVKAQVHGFPSADNEKNSKIKKENEGLGFDGNEKFYKDRSDISKKRSDRRYELKKSGLQSRELAKDKDFDKEFKDKTVFNENKKMKRLHFSKTVFLNEEEMIKKIPQDMKIDGNRFFMKDSIGNEYLVECVRDRAIKEIIHTNIVDYKNDKLFNEEINKMKQLAEYKSSNVQTRIDESTTNENERVRKMIDKTKKFIIK